MRILMFLFILALPLAATAQNYPAYQSTYINDFADLLPPDSEARVLAMLKAVREERGVEMTVVTVQSRLDYGPSPSIEAFATGLFNSWGVGNATRNDGIMILIAKQDRTMRIELGAGYPPTFDDRVKRVIDHHFIPWFKQDDYANGIEAGVAETIKRTWLEFTDEGYTASSRLKAERDYAIDNAKSGGLFAWIFGAVGLALSGYGLFGWRRWQRNRPRQCDLCGRKMTRLSEEDDDARLNQGQKVEESLKSKDYDVWYCRHDDNVLIEGYRKWFSGYAACDICGFRTLYSKRTAITAATTSNSGQARIDKTCRNCDYSDTDYVTIPMISKSSSSSSSGSFGGGSSSGGGASGSW